VSNRSWHDARSGYMSPEYAMDGVFSVKSDVFSFGVLVLEIVSGRKNRGMYSSGEQTSLLSQAWRLWREGNALALLDEAVVRAGTHRSSEVLRCVQVALLCVQERPDDRPHMAAVFLALGNPSAVLPQPRHPGYCTDRGSASTDGEWSSTCTVNDVTVTIVEGR
jgi:serine/threonine protein kinase